MRGAVYYDGFNLYHAINDLGKAYLKWCNLWKLAELICKGHARSVEKAVFCTAYFPGDTGKKARHAAYVAALANVGVETRLGHTISEPESCVLRSCGHRWTRIREKETDINLGLAVFADAVDDVYDVGFVVTADTDQAATFKAVASRFPAKRLYAVAPPGRHPSKHLTDLAHGNVRLTEAHIDACLFNRTVTKEGARTIVRPPEYDPPAGWVHPDERPRPSTR